MRYFLATMLLIGLYIICFDWIEYQRLSHSQEYNVYRLKNPEANKEEGLELINNPERKQS